MPFEPSIKIAVPQVHLYKVPGFAFATEIHFERASASEMFGVEVDGDVPAPVYILSVFNGIESLI